MYVCMNACEVVGADVSYVCLSEKALFLGVFALQMKPKTLKKLTKHSDPRWLMGWEK